MISTSTIGSKEDPYPMISNIWEFFNEKGTKTVFLSVGSGQTPLPELDICESLGCPILKLDTQANCDKWEECKEILKTRKAQDTTSDFAKAAQKKWVLPRNIHVTHGIPMTTNGSVDFYGKQIPSISLIDAVIQHCKNMNIEEPRLDLLKVEDCAFESEVLHALILQGLRPAFLLICWNETPDTNTTSMITAGNLQMIGYSLIAKEKNRFLYYYTDVNYYESCSWEEVSTNLQNPFVNNIVKTIYPNTTRNVLAFPKKLG